MELAPTLHVRPDAADEVGRGAVAQDVVLRHVLLQRRLEDVHQRQGELHGLRRVFVHGARDGLRRGEIVLLQKCVDHRINAGKIIVVQLAPEDARPGGLLRLDALIGAQHLRELVRLQKAHRLGVFQLFQGFRKLCHGVCPPVAAH